MWRPPWVQDNPKFRAKRAFDLLGASLGLIVAGPVLAAAAVTIRATMGAPIFFQQARPGYKGASFTIRKFRTMSAATTDEVWFRTDAVRVTRLGAFLRRTSIDELPELLNVLKGDMSLVGPRPLLIEYLNKYTPEEMRRHDVPPGITGWAQVNGRQHALFSARLTHDVWYVDNWSFLTDLRILARTVLGVLKWDGVVVGQDVDDVDDIGLSADRSRLVGGDASNQSGHHDPSTSRAKGSVAEKE